MKKIMGFLILFISFILVSTSCNRISGTNEDAPILTMSATPVAYQQSTVLPTLAPTGLRSRTPTSIRVSTIIASPTMTPSFLVPKATEVIKGVTGTNLPHDGATDYLSYIGIDIPPMPSCCVLEGGGFIEGQKKYAIDLVSDKDSFMIWISKMGSGSSQRVIDIVTLPKLHETDIISANYCQVNGIDDPYIFTISSLDREAVIKRFISNEKIQRAWRFNSLTGEIDEVSTAGIECFGEGGFDPNNVIYKLLK